MVHDGKRHDWLYAWLLNMGIMLDMKYGIYIMSWEGYSNCNRPFAHSQLD